MYSQSIQDLIEVLAKFPNVGPKAAQRITFYLLSLPKTEIKEILTIIAKAKNKVKACPACFKRFEEENQLCEICSNQTRIF